MKMYHSKENTIFIDNVDINQINCFSIRENITKITQDVYLFPVPIKDNLQLASIKATDADLESELADNFLNLMKDCYTILSISHKKEFLKYSDVIYEISSDMVKHASEK